MSAEAAPEIIMDARGFYWRRYPEHLSMCPTTDDNEPVEVATVYLPAEFGAVYWRTLALRLQSDLGVIRESRDEKQRLSTPVNLDALEALASAVSEGFPDYGQVLVAAPTALALVAGLRSTRELLDDALRELTWNGAGGSVVADEIRGVLATSDEREVEST